MADLNAAFWKWFGKSKVVDSDGKPLVVYHGTQIERGDSLFTEFRTPTWFTTRKDDAQSYADGRHDDDFERIVVPAFLSIERPYSAAKSECLLEAYDGKFINRLRTAGYDGIRCEYFKGNEYWIAFDPKQIKSIKNDGTWDADDPNIRSNPSRRGIAYTDVGHYRKDLEPLWVFTRDRRLIVKEQEDPRDTHGMLFQPDSTDYDEVFPVPDDDENENKPVGKYDWFGRYDSLFNRVSVVPPLTETGAAAIAVLPSDLKIYLQEAFGRGVKFVLFDASQNQGQYEGEEDVHLDLGIRNNPFGDRRVLSRQEAEAYVSSGSIPVTRTEGYTPVFFSEDAIAQQKGPWDWHGMYYFVGEDGDEVIPLGPTFIFNNKVDAMIQLGYSRKKVASKLHYYFDGHHKRGVTIDEFLEPYISGKTSRWYGDWADSFIAQQAKRNGADNVILLREPNAEHGYNTGTEVVDLHSVKTKHWSEVDLHEMFGQNPDDGLGEA